MPPSLRQPGGLVRISLTEHHRSSCRIVTACQLIRPKDPPLESVHGDGLHVRLAQCQTDEQEVRRHALRPATAHRAPHPRRASSQVSLVVHQLQMWRARGRAWREMCVLGFTKDSLTAFQQALEVVGVPVVLRNVEKKNEEGDGVTLGTIHSVKGWECPIVCVVRLSYDTTKTDERTPAFGWNIFCRAGGAKVDEQKAEKVRLLFVAA